MSRAARVVHQTCPNCSLVHDVGVYVSGQRVLCKCGIRFEVRRADVRRESSAPLSAVQPRGVESPPGEAGEESSGIQVLVTPAPVGEIGAPSNVLADEPSTDADAFAATRVPSTLRSGTPEPIPEDAFSATVTPRPGDTMLSGAPVQLKGYTLHELLGRGGMGEVWRATQVSLGRTVAVKLLPPRHASDPEFVTRFEKEATALASLNHPHIVQIIDRGVEAEHYYFVMEYVEGRSLRDRIHQRALTWSDSLRIALQVARAIECAHDTGIIHRDLKPENILLDSRGQVKVADFGLAGISGTDPHLQLTGTAVAMGTLNYMAPEQRRDARNVDGRADLYSLGVMIYEMLTGELPIGRFRMPTERDPGVDPRVDAIIAETLEPEPDRRYPSARPLCEALEEILASVSTRPSRPVSRPAEHTTDVLPARPRSRARRTWSNLRTGLAIVGVLAVLSVVFSWGPGTQFSLHLGGQTKVIDASGDLGAGLADAPVQWPPNTNDEIFVAAIEGEKDVRGESRSLEIGFGEGEEEINLHEGQWRLEGEQLVVTQAGNESSRAKLVPRAYLAHRYYSTDDFEVEVDMSVSPLSPAFRLGETAQRFGELAMRIHELQVSVFAIPGVGMRLLWKYLAPDGREVIGNSARDIDNLIEDETPVPKEGPFRVRLKMRRVSSGTEVTAFLNGSRFARKILPGLQGQIGKVALGCRNLQCTFDDLTVEGAPKPRPIRPTTVAKD